MKFLSLFTLLVFTAQPTYADEQNTKEKAIEAAIVAAVNEDLPLALDSLEKSVNINSGTMNFVGVKAVGAHFKAELEALGFKAELTDGTSHADKSQSRRGQFHRVANIVLQVNYLVLQQAAHAEAGGHKGHRD